MYFFSFFCLRFCFDAFFFRFRRVTVINSSTLMRRLKCTKSRIQLTEFGCSIYSACTVLDVCTFNERNECACAHKWCLLLMNYWNGIHYGVHLFEQFYLFSYLSSLTWHYIRWKIHNVFICTDNAKTNARDNLSVVLFFKCNAATSHLDTCSIESIDGRYELISMGSIARRALKTDDRNEFTNISGQFSVSIKKHNEI